MPDHVFTNWFAGARRRRAERALERQLDYQFEKARLLQSSAEKTAQDLRERTAEKRRMLESFRPISPADRVLEVGSGAHGLIFNFGNRFGIGVDPLAVHYKQLFPKWQRNADTIAAAGEHLPFADDSFDVVLCDNVIDHAEQPFEIVAEIMRVLKSGGLLYFTVNVHHPIYRTAARLHNLWNAIGLHYEITPFADHTVHCTKSGVTKFFDRLPLRVLHRADTVALVKEQSRAQKIRNLEQRFKRAFYKNAQFEIIAIRN